MWMNSLICHPLCLTYFYCLSQQLCEADSAIPLYGWRNWDSRDVEELVRCQTTTNGKDATQA